MQRYKRIGARTAFTRPFGATSLTFSPTYRARHTKCKVERSQQTDGFEFYSSADLADPDLLQGFKEWQFFYNWHRPHCALNGYSLMERCCQLLDQTPLLEEVEAQYGAKLTRAKVRDFMTDQRLAELKRCL
jgi:transposase InsO family protein